MNPADLIRKKRDGEELTRHELESFIGSYVRGEVPDYQMSAFLMAVYFRGMAAEETLVFTETMLHSGSVLDLSTVAGRKVDKHSTGGVGDKVSLLLAPMVAACGVPVPMISGRGLGHTGGTLDKLESIPGFRTNLSGTEFRSALGSIGVALAGQTEEIAPADRRMYALRDVTGTVESLPLIAGSIMSKKLAEGIDALVLDVKTGQGAFMESSERAVELAQLLVGIGNRYGKHTVAFVTAMDQPLGHAVGNWLEVTEAVECLKGRTIADLMEVTFVLGGAMVFLGGKASTIDEGIHLCRSALWSGRAFDKFLGIVEGQGGDVSAIRNPAKMDPAAFISESVSDRGGVLSAFDTRRIGLLAVGLGAGRRTIEDIVDPRAGIVVLKKLGDTVRAGEPLAQIHGARKDLVDHAAKEFGSCVMVSEAGDPPGPRIRGIVDGDGYHPWRTPITF